MPNKAWPGVRTAITAEAATRLVAAARFQIERQWTHLAFTLPPSATFFVSVITAELAVRIEMMRLGGANLPLGRSEDAA